MKYCDRQENQIEYYLKDADLIDYFKEIEYKENRKYQNLQEKVYLINKVKHINTLALPANKQLVYNLYTKKLKWIHNFININS